MHVAQLRKELDDPLFSRTAADLAFTPGGLRLASRAVEILGLQQQTAIEVTEAAHGRRLLRIAASSGIRRACRARADRTILVTRQRSLGRIERARRRAGSRN